MNISNVQQYLNAGSFANRAVASDAEVHLPEAIKVPKKEADIAIQEPSLPGSKKGGADKKGSEPNWETLVMKPSPISLEERMSQVISPEQVKDLLALIARFPVEDKIAEHNLDVKR